MRVDVMPIISLRIRMTGVDANVQIVRAEARVGNRWGVVVGERIVVCGRNWMRTGVSLGFYTWLGARD